MGDLSKDFSASELRCRCGCGGLKLDPCLVPALQRLRDLAGVACIVHDAYRCPAHNAIVGGVLHSKHELGAAADVTLIGLSYQEMYALARRVPAFGGPGCGAIGVYDTPPRIHVDVRRGGHFEWAVKGANEAQLPIGELIPV